MIDALLVNNGYSKSKLDQIKKNKNKNRKTAPGKRSSEKLATLKIPFLSDKCTAQIKRAAIAHEIPVRVVTTPGRKLKNILTSSRPCDKPRCPNIRCRTCTALKGKGICTDANLIYGMWCELGNCSQEKIGQYDGETLRPIDDRFLEHYKSARNPDAKSYANKPMAKHYKQYHQGCSEPKIGLQITEKTFSTNERKVKESRIILQNKSDLNSREEYAELKRFLV